MKCQLFVSIKAFQDCVFLLFFGSFIRQLAVGVIERKGRFSVSKWLLLHPSINAKDRVRIVEHGLLLYELVDADVVQVLESNQDQFLPLCLTKLHLFSVREVKVQGCVGSIRGTKEGESLTKRPPRLVLWSLLSRLVLAECACWSRFRTICRKAKVIVKITLLDACPHTGNAIKSLHRSAIKVT